MLALSASRRGRIQQAITIAMVAGLLPGPSQADAVPVAALKAAFLYNFVRFTEWPSDAFEAGRPLSMCVVGEIPIVKALEQTVKGRQAGGRPLSVRTVSLDDNRLRSCHLLYFGTGDAARVHATIERLMDAPVFTVGMTERFAERGGVGELFLEEDRMQFAINVGAAQRARLTLSSKLLSLARIVRDRRDGNR